MPCIVDDSKVISPRNCCLEAETLDAIPPSEGNFSGDCDLFLLSHFPLLGPCLAAWLGGLQRLQLCSAARHKLHLSNKEERASERKVCWKPNYRVAYQDFTQNMEWNHATAQWIA